MQNPIFKNYGDLGYAGVAKSGHLFISEMQRAFTGNGATICFANDGGLITPKENNFRIQRSLRERADIA
jgi:hypothetical protein